ncbi:hypothetical protein [Massilia sp. BSC265]|nr:hypothetical protein [Massilia sp. BSC265]
MSTPAKNSSANPASQLGLSLRSCASSVVFRQLAGVAPSAYRDRVAGAGA